MAGYTVITNWNQADWTSNNSYAMCQKFNPTDKLSLCVVLSSKAASHFKRCLRVGSVFDSYYEAYDEEGNLTHSGLASAYTALAYL